MKEGKANGFFLFLFIMIFVPLIIHSADNSICTFRFEPCIDKDDPSKMSSSLTFASFNGQEFAISDQKYSDLVSRHSDVKTLIVHNHTLVNPVAFFAPSLKVLKLPHGTLKIFSLFAHLQQMLQLQELDLSYNEITTLNSAPTPAVSHDTVFGNLKKLNLSHNQLKVLDFPLLNRLNGLEEVDLSSNLIHTIAGVSVPEIATSLRFFPRTMTTVLLAYNNLCAADKDSLIAYHDDLSPCYTKRLEKQSYKWGFIMAFLGSVALCGAGNWYYLNDGSSTGREGAAAALIGIDMVGIVGGALSFGALGARLGRAYATSKTPLHQRRIQIFDFIFETTEKQRDETLACDLSAGN